MEARHERLPAEHRDTDAAGAAFQRRLLAAPRRGQADAFLHHGAGRRRRARVLRDRRERHTKQGAADLRRGERHHRAGRRQGQGRQGRSSWIRCCSWTNSGKSCANAGWRAGAIDLDIDEPHIELDDAACRCRSPRATAETRTSSSRNSCSAPTRPSRSGSWRWACPSSSACTKCRTAKRWPSSRCS